MRHALNFTQLAKKIVPLDVPYITIPLMQGRLPTPAIFPSANQYYGAGIALPDVDIELSMRYVVQMLPDDPLILKVIEELLIKESIITTSPMSPLDYGTFAILHEVGHWYDFQTRYIKNGLTGSDYYNDYKKEAEKLELNLFTKRIQAERRGSDEQLNLLREYHEKYRSNIFEIKADNYAINAMKMMK